MEISLSFETHFLYGGEGDLAVFSSSVCQGYRARSSLSHVASCDLAHISIFHCTGAALADCVVGCSSEGGVKRPPRSGERSPPLQVHDGSYKMEYRRDVVYGSFAAYSAGDCCQCCSVRCDPLQLPAL